MLVVIIVAAAVLCLLATSTIMMACYVGSRSKSPSEVEFELEEQRKYIDEYCKRKAKKNKK